MDFATACFTPQKLNYRYSSDSKIEVHVPTNKTVILPHHRPAIHSESKIIKFFARIASLSWGSFTVFPLKPWTPDKISGMLIVSWPIRCEMKPQQITAKPQHGVVTTWQETTSWLFLPWQIFMFTVIKRWTCTFSILAYVSENSR